MIRLRKSGKVDVNAAAATDAGPTRAADDKPERRTVGHRQFLKMLAGAAGLAGVVGLAESRTAEATYIPGPPDVVNTSLTVQGDLTANGVVYATAVRWGNGTWPNILNTDQAGSIKLGNSLATGTTPYLDFMFGKGQSQGYNMRLINSADGRLDIQGGTVGISGGTLELVNGTSNLIRFPGLGYAPPTPTAAGWKIKLWDQGNLADSYGIGIEGGHAWINTYTGLKVYSRGTLMMNVNNTNGGTITLGSKVVADTAGCYYA